MGPPLLFSPRPFSATTILLKLPEYVPDYHPLPNRPERLLALPSLFSTPATCHVFALFCPAIAIFPCFDDRLEKRSTCTGTQGCSSHEGGSRAPVSPTRSIKIQLSLSLSLSVSVSVRRAWKRTTYADSVRFR